jgi:hypothetical protein
MQSSLYKAYHRLRCMENKIKKLSIAEHYHRQIQEYMDKGYARRLMRVKFLMKVRIFGFCHISLW